MMTPRSVKIDWLSRGHRGSDGEGFVTSTTRRWIYFVDCYGEEHQGTASTRALDITVGDIIHFEQGSDQFLIDHYKERKNCFKRRYGKKIKLLSANIDLLFIVTAVGQLFQPSFIDRVLCMATLEDIPVCLVVNKTDLEIDSETHALIDVYRNLGLDLILTNTIDNNGLIPFLEYLSVKEPRVLSLVGVSGVGKSSILNRLVPHAERTTRQVSEKSGQGRQTTSQAEAFLYNNNNSSMFVIDLPGIQSFGVGDLNVKQLQSGMLDIFGLGQACEFSDCQHVAEEKCAVKMALDEGVLPPSRFQSYIEMLEDIESSREW